MSEAVAWVRELGRLLCCPEDDFEFICCLLVRIPSYQFAVTSRVLACVLQYDNTLLADNIWLGGSIAYVTEVGRRDLAFTSIFSHPCNLKLTNPLDTCTGSWGRICVCTLAHGFWLLWVCFRFFFHCRCVMCGKIVQTVTMMTVECQWISTEPPRPVPTLGPCVSSALLHNAQNNSNDFFLRRSPISSTVCWAGCASFPDSTCSCFS